MKNGGLNKDRTKGKCTVSRYQGEASSSSGRLSVLTQDR